MSSIPNSLGFSVLAVMVKFCYGLEPCLYNLLICINLLIFSVLEIPHLWCCALPGARAEEIPFPCLDPTPRF